MNEIKKDSWSTIHEALRNCDSWAINGNSLRMFFGGRCADRQLSDAQTRMVNTFWYKY
jgi:hypothetical protein